LKFIVPGDPTDSYLVQKLLGTSAIRGDRMPLNGPYPESRRHCRSAGVGHGRRD